METFDLKILKLVYEHDKEHLGGSFPITLKGAEQIQSSMDEIHQSCVNLKGEGYINIKNVAREIGSSEINTIRIEITESGKAIFLKESKKK